MKTPMRNKSCSFAAMPIPFRSLAIGLAVVFTAQLPATAQPKPAQPRQKSPPKAEAQPPQTGFLGVMASPSPTRGVYVDIVDPDSPADKAGLRSGDYVLTVDGKDISSPDQLVTAIQSRKPGTEISLVSWRDGTEATHKATLAASRSPARQRIARRRPGTVPRRRAYRAVIRGLYVYRVYRQGYYCDYYVRPPYYQYVCYPRPYYVRPNPIRFRYYGPQYGYRYSW